MIKQKLTLLLTTVIISFKTVYPQFSQEPAAVASPNAATLGEFGEIPVSLFTGTPKISIPLHTVECNGFKMPVTLDYHASGIRPDQHPGWTGIGWSINVGGIITREVNDRADDESDDYITTGMFNYAPYGYYHRHALLDSPSWSDRNYIRNLAQGFYPLDTEPDRFSFNFLGYSGNFYLDASGKWKVQSNSNIYVEMLGFNIVPMKNNDIQKDIKTFGGFRLTTEDGTKYIFGKENPSETERDESSPIDYSINIFRQSYDMWTATSWYLSKIILPNDDVITFSYDRVNYICQMYRYTHNIVASKEEYEGIFGSDLSSEGFGVVWPTLPNSYCGKLISPVYLSQINFPNGDMIGLWKTNMTKSTEELKYSYKAFEKSYDEKAEHYMFYQNSTNNFTIFDCIDSLKWQSLGAVCVTNKAGSSFIYQFTYTKDPDRRLTLTKLTKTFSYAPVCSYEFEYYKPGMMPGYFEEETDHWGYCNGVATTTYGKDLKNYHKLREPDPEKMKYGVLTKIIYPTGGYTRFEYEPHTYAKVVNKSRQSLELLQDEKIAGGLRIKRIYGSTTGKSSDEQMMKEYHYVKGYSSGGTEPSGILGGKIQYLFENYPVYSFNYNDAVAILSVFSSQSVLPMSENSARSHIGYSEVAEKYANGSFRIYKYTNFDSGIFDEPCASIIQRSTTEYEPYSSRAMERGLLTSMEEYDSDGNLKYKKNITYEPDGDKATSYVPAVKATMYSLPNGVAAICYDEGAAYKFFTYSMRKKTEEEYFYENNVTLPFHKAVSYTYDTQKQIKKIVENIQPGIRHETEYYYQGTRPYNFPYRIEKRTFHNDTETGSEIVSYSLVRYGSCCVRVSKENRTVNGVEKPPISYLYDDSGFLRYASDGLFKTIYLWGYSHKYVVAKIVNADMYQVESVIGGYDEFAESYSPDYSKIDRLRTILPNALVYTYEYSDAFLGISAITDPSGRRTEYHYYNGSLSDVRDEYGNVLEAYDYNYRK